MESEGRVLESVGAARQRRFYRPEDRGRLLEEFDRSGQSVHEFCLQRGIGKSSLTTWRRHQRRQAEDAGGMVKVAVAKGPQGDAAASCAVIIRLKGGEQLEVLAGTEVEWVAQLTRRLQACSI